MQSKRVFKHTRMYVGTLLKVPRAYKKVFSDSLTAKDGLCEFLSNSLISLAVRLFYWIFCKKSFVSNDDNICCNSLFLLVFLIEICCLIICSNNSCIVWCANHLSSLELDKYSFKCCLDCRNYKFI